MIQFITLPRSLVRCGSVPYAAFALPFAVRLPVGYCARSLRCRCPTVYVPAPLCRRSYLNAFVRLLLLLRGAFRFLPHVCVPFTLRLLLRSRCQLRVPLIPFVPPHALHLLPTLPRFVAFYTTVNGGLRWLPRLIGSHYPSSPRCPCHSRCRYTFLPPRFVLYALRAVRVAFLPVRSRFVRLVILPRSFCVHLAFTFI